MGTAPVICGIYEIVDKFNRCYIGSSVDIYKRWDLHRRELRAGKHHSYRLQRAWDRFGEKDFTFRILQFVEDEATLLAREQYFLDVFGPAFNIAAVAGRPEWSDLKRDQARARALDRKLLQEIRDHADWERREADQRVVDAFRDLLREVAGLYVGWRGLLADLERKYALAEGQRDPFNSADPLYYVDSFGMLARSPTIADLTPQLLEYAQRTRVYYAWVGRLRWSCPRAYRLLMNTNVCWNPA
jgi:hypothetical protein